MGIRLENLVVKFGDLGYLINVTYKFQKES